MDPLTIVAIVLVLVAVAIGLPDLIKWFKSLKELNKEHNRPYNGEPRPEPPPIPPAPYELESEITPYELAAMGDKPRVIPEEYRPTAHDQRVNRMMNLLDLINECDKAGATTAASRLRGAAAILASEDTSKIATEEDE